MPNVNKNAFKLMFAYPGTFNGRHNNVVNDFLWAIRGIGIFSKQDFVSYSYTMQNQMHWWLNQERTNLNPYIYTNSGCHHE